MLCHFEKCQPWGRTYQPRRTPVVNWTQIHNHSLAAIFYTGLPSTLHVSEKWKIELPTFLYCAAEPTSIKKFLVLYFDQWDWDLPVQLKPCYILICIYTDQSEQLHNNQSEQCSLDQSTCANLKLHVDGPIRDGGGGRNFCLYKPAIHLFRWSVLSAAFPQLVSCNTWTATLEL